MSAAATLVVNADDLGLDPHLDDGILRAHRHGIVTSASLVANGAAFDRAAALCREAPDLDIGVHLMLVDGVPLRRRSPLARDGCRFPASVPRLIAARLSGAMPDGAVRDEWKAQIERVAAAGLRITHLDSHRHVHALPRLAAIAAELSEGLGIRYVRVPVPCDKGARALSVRGAGAFGLRVACAVSGLSGRAGALRFAGFFDGGRLDRARLERVLCSLPPGGATELMCHPGFAPTDPSIRRWGYEHEGELDALTAPQTRAMLTRLEIRLCRFSDLT